jgi:sigma-E factor negative regulatory protein RseC
VLPQTLATATAGYQVGDSVKLVLSASLGMKAVILAYGLPLLVLLVAILVFSALKLEQLYVGLFSLAAVAVYYIIFAIFRDKLDKEFVFHIEQ